MSFAELRHHLETLHLELGVEVEAVGGAVGEGQQKHGADAGACGLIRRGGDEVITSGREGLVFEVGAELAIKVEPLRLFPVEGPELELGNLFWTNGSGEGKLAVDVGVNDVV